MDFIFRVELQKTSDKYSGVYDFALIKIKTVLILEDLIQPICLPFNTSKLLP